MDKVCSLCSILLIKQDIVITFSQHGEEVPIKRNWGEIAIICVLDVILIKTGGKGSLEQHRVWRWLNVEAMVDQLILKINHYDYKVGNLIHVDLEEMVVFSRDNVLLTEVQQIYV